MCAGWSYTGGPAREREVHRNKLVYSNMISHLLPALWGISMKLRDNRDICKYYKDNEAPNNQHGGKVVPNHK